MNYKKISMRKNNNHHMLSKGYKYEFITIRVTKTIYKTFEAWVSETKKEYVEFYKQI